MEKRQEILKASFVMLSQASYDSVLLKEIAQKAGISKSLLQHYFPKKSSIVEALMQDLLNVSFRFAEDMIPGEEGIFQRFSLHTSLFYTALSQNERLDRMFISILSDKELLDLWVEAATSWVVGPYHELGNAGDENKLRIGLYYGLSGGGELYMHRDELQIDTTFIADQMNTSMMWIFGCPEKEIKKVLSRTSKVFDEKLVTSFEEYFEKHIPWMMP
ncbi:TetR/AcrR family transcriptional regulator [Christensenellaceae bacterium OttesenSCG-928-M15]|nr:TetR/AcrR family transcriptional regulator [Christensenellaceae bacterium OttesenSCG-928-M15]